MVLSMGNLTLSLPMPIFVVIEDIGWWQGEDGSADNQPFRNAFPRRHCLEDYRAVLRLARRLKMRIALGLVLGEWDRLNLLAGVVGATWQAKDWDNRLNQGPWLDEAAQFLRENQEWLEIACHGLCHEFWREGKLERSEFHDADGWMRPTDLVKNHLAAYAEILADYSLPGFPRIFLPPALHHSFGNGENSIQALLAEFGTRHVITIFSRARQYSAPLHPKITWECGVGLLERGLSPVPWHQVAAHPSWDGKNPVLALHWGNLLHLDPAKNIVVVDNWADMLLSLSESMEYVLADDYNACWSQAAVWHLVTPVVSRGRIVMDLRGLNHVPGFNGLVVVKIKCTADQTWHCRGGKLVSCQRDSSGMATVTLRCLPSQTILEIVPRS